MSKPDFSNFEKIKVDKDATATYKFWRLEGAPILEVRPANEVNPEYMDRILSKGSGIVKAMKGKKMKTETLQAGRVQDYKLYPKYIVVDWPVAPRDANGEEVPFSKENCEAFLRSLRSDIFNELRDFCTDLDNFVDDDDLDSDDVEEISGN